jgi:CHAT domain-containing protein
VNICDLVGCHSRPTPESLRDQISLNIRHGDLQDASPLADQALLLYGGSNPEWSWRFRILKAHILASQSAGVEALAILHDDVPPSLAATDIPVRKAMLEGMAYRVTQNFDQSREQFAVAEDLANRNQPALLCEVLNFKGALEVQETRYKDAESTYNRALKLSRDYRRADQEASAQVSLAWLAAKQERFDESVERGRAALNLSRSMEMKGLAAATLGNLGWSYTELGDFEAGLDFFKQSAAESERSGLTGNIAYWFAGIAYAQMALHDYASAEALAKETLERARRINNAQTITECLNILARIALITGRLDEAQQYNQKALKIEEDGADHFGVLDSFVLAGRIEARKGHFDQAEKLLRRVLDDPIVEKALRWDVQARIAELDDVRDLPVKAEQEYRNAIATFEDARSSIAADDFRLSFLEGAIEFYDDYVDFLIRRGRGDEALRVAELSRAQTLEEGLAGGKKPAAVANGGVHSQQLAKRLHATMLFYWLGQEHSYIWVITPAKTSLLRLPPASEIDPIVKSYRETLIGNRDPLEGANENGQKLYAMLVAPAQNLIPQGSRIILLPDGSLNALNFETLIVPGPKPHFLIEDATLTTASSLSLLASAANRTPPKQKNLLLVGDALKAGDEFDPLPNAEDEMKIVEGYFGESNRTVLKRERATPGAYLASNPQRYAYLHFVTHGTASRAQPLESAVILSKEPASDTYKLYAREIVTRHLNAELVTISACNGSGTRGYSGEGLVGLSWAFVRAGAHNVIAALWEVSNAPSTSQLMDAFYKGISQGEDPATALRNAKLLMLHSGNVFTKPYYWAPFQLYTGS